MRAQARTRPTPLQRIALAARTFGETVTRLSDAVLTKEIGIVGGTIENGVTVPNYNAELAGRAWFEKVDEMLLASSQAAVIELCVTLPIISAEWSLTGGDASLRTQVETSLFGTQGMSTTWREVLYNACGSSLYGTSAFEIVWKETDEGLLVRRLADRDPSSIEQYLPSPDGGLEAVLQKGLDPDSGDEVEIEIPIEKMLLFPYRLRRRQYHGRSILRPAYRHYESIAMLCTFADIGLDHSMVGVPVGKAPQNAKPVDLEAFRSLLAMIRRHEASGLVMPYGWDLVDGVQLGGSDQIGFLPYIQWHEGCFLRSGLCSFMQLGSTATGTTELGGDLMDFGIMAWSALADMVAGVFNRHLIRRHCDYNAGRELDEKAYPSWSSSRPRRLRDLAEPAAGRQVHRRGGQRQGAAPRGPRAAQAGDGRGLAAAGQGQPAGRSTDHAELWRGRRASRRGAGQGRRCVGARRVAGPDDTAAGGAARQPAAAGRPGRRRPFDRLRTSRRAPGRSCAGARVGG